MYSLGFLLVAGNLFVTFLRAPAKLDHHQAGALGSSPKNLRLAAKEQLTLAVDLYERSLGANHETTMQAKEALSQALEMS